MIYIPESWSDTIAEVAEQFMNATIQVLEPSGGEPTYNEALKDYVMPEPVVLVECVARIQHVRVPNPQNTEYQWSMGRHYRFQVPYSDVEGLYIRKGLIVKVLDGGRDAELNDLLFEVLGATNSSHRAVRTIETVMNPNAQFGGSS